MLFAGIMLILMGAFNVLDGLVALFNEEWFAVTADGLLTASFTAWGWFWLATGALAAAAGFGVLAGQMWARVIGVVVAAVNAIAQLAFTVAYPIWSIVIIVLDVVVIYALVVHGREARPEVDAE